MLQNSISLAAVSVLAMIAISTGAAQESKLAKNTYVYKTVGKTAIHADVHRPTDKKVRPCLVWIHGGALINGHRGSVPGRLLKLAKERGYVLISLDYRLAPETKLPGIIQDVKDAFVWIRTKGPKLFDVNPKRMVVAGGSAGGYLTMSVGMMVKPAPLGLVAYWGYGDVDGEWYTKPSRHYRKRPLIKKKVAYSAVGKGIVTNAKGEQGRGRGRFYLYLRQNGLWTSVVTGFDPQKDRDKLTNYCPVRNITPKYPPILMIHGTNDTDVPYSLSADMAKELKRKGVWHRLITVKNGGHGLGGGDPKVIQAAHEQASAFIREKLE